jgi:protein involved in temperature-dependent protein secretion
MHNLLPEQPPTLLSDEPVAAKALEEALALGAGAAGEAGAPVGRVVGERALDPGSVGAVTAGLKEVAGHFPTYSDAWGRLAEWALGAGDTVTAYAYARTGYHRGLDQLRRSGWRGTGPVPWAHAPNRGFLRCLHALAQAADAIGEADEAARCAQFLRDCDPRAADALTG